MGTRRVLFSTAKRYASTEGRCTLSYVALVGPEIEENLSLRYLASSLAAAGYDSALVPFNTEADFGAVIDAILRAPVVPKLVGISLAFQWRAQDFLALAVALKRGGYEGHVTIGGHFGTFASDEILNDFPEVDSVCHQEAEETIVHLARALGEGRAPTGIAGLAVRNDYGAVVHAIHPTLPDLATLPRPDRRGPPAACFAHGIAPLVSSRGCYANCSFCCIAAWQEQSLPGKRYRLREVDDVADEMVELKRTRGIDIFVFHDDNFFVPGHRKNAERFAALADALDRRDIGAFATVVKARPTDTDAEVFSILRHRLNCIRVYIGIETDADQGLKTLRRWAKSNQNRRSIELVRTLGLYTCFNVLLFDPDTTLDSVETNIAFMRYAAEFPFNFGRVELYAGTPLLARMQSEGRVRGDYMQWDYDLAGEDVERVFKLALEAFHARNFGDDALANRIMGTRFDVEVVRHFHRDVFRQEWLDEGCELNRILSRDTADGLEKIVTHVKSGAHRAEDARIVIELSRGLRATEQLVGDRCRTLARTLQKSVGQGAPLTEIGDRVATPLQTPRKAVGLSLSGISGVGQ
jgi:anaerobic magnesium-protoporphyrin IX monomethyl ester cyclase